MVIRETMEINASAAEVFRVYKNVEGWQSWDPEVLAAHLPRGLVPGAVGWLEPRRGPKSSIAVGEVRPGHCFTIESRLPFCKITFGHDLVGRDSVCTVTHWVTFTGLLSPLFRYLIGRPIAATLPDTLAGLKNECE